MRRVRLLLSVSVGVVLGWSCVAVAAAAELQAYVSAPARIPPGATAPVTALVINAGDSDAIVTYKLDVSGLAVEEPSRELRVWIARRSFLALRWQAKAEQKGPGRTVLLLDGRSAAEERFEVADPSPPASVAVVSELSAEPFAIEMPEAGRAYTVTLEVVGGAAGELAATLAGLRSVRGLNPDALVARGAVPAALGNYRAEPELGILYALQDSSGGWGADPGATPDMRSTSWVVFWLGSLSHWGRTVDAKVLDGAIDHLRKRLVDVTPDMRARGLAALAAAGAARKSDLESLTKADAPQLGPAGRLFGALAGADIPLPPQAEWSGLNALETAVLTCALRYDAQVRAEAGALLRQLVVLRGAEPSFDTHEAALCALALKWVAHITGGTAEGRITVTLDGKPVYPPLKLSRDEPVARREVHVPARPGTKGKLAVAGPAAPGVFCRVVVRPVP